MLEIVNASFGYKTKRGEKAVVRDLGMTLKKGELVCLLGANGSGKTTIFRTILGQLPLLSGSITIDGEPIGNMSAGELAEKIAYVPQSHTPGFPYTVAEVVEMGRCRYTGVFSSPSADDRRIVRETLERLGIQHLESAAYTELSGGERQLVLIARALAQNAGYLLLDEPVSSLDYGNQLMVLSEIKRLAAGDMGVLVVLHNPEHALMLDSETVAILGSSDAIRGRTRELLEPELMKKLYGVRTETKDWSLSDGSPVRSIYPLWSDKK